jgi:hypothetical protein
MDKTQQMFQNLGRDILGKKRSTYLQLFTRVHESKKIISTVKAFFLFGMRLTGRKMEFRFSGI